MLSSAVLVIVVVVVGLSGSGEAHPGKFEKYAEQYKPIRDLVCAGKATKPQMANMVVCMDQFKASFNNKHNKTAEVKQIIADCLAEGDKDITFEVDKSAQELVFLMCSKKFGGCLHERLPMHRRWNNNNSTQQQMQQQESTGPPPTVPGGDLKIETLIACEKKALNIS